MRFDIYSKYAWAVTLKDKEVITNTNAFQNIIDESKRKPNKIFVDKDSEFYNRPMKSWLQEHNIDIYLTHNEGKSVVAETSVRTLYNKIFNYMTSISKNVYIDRLDDTADK